MKKILALLSALLFFCGGASAQRFRIGLRGGISTVKQHFDRVYIGDRSVAPGKAQVGYEAGLVLRLNITRHIHLQSELNYAFANYDFRLGNSRDRDLRIRTERFEIPVQLGLQFGAFRLFGGAGFRVSQSGRSDDSQQLKVRFNDDDIAVMGGVGFNIRKFFFDFRVSGYPRSHIRNTFVCDGVAQRVRVDRSVPYGGSIGFFF